MAPKETVAAAGKNHTVPVYQLKVEIDDITPGVWRRLLVPGDARLAWLHAVLQVAVGWQNSHLHQFRIDGHLYSDTRHNFNEFSETPAVLDSGRVTLQELVPVPASKFRYEYDFGDGWRHSISVETIEQPPLVAPIQAICVAGARAGPPEDCGGPWGYSELLKILGNPKHPEYPSRVEWLGGEYDSEHFDLLGVNHWLRQLTWPKVSDSALRKVLMARDGVKA